MMVIAYDISASIIKQSVKMRFLSIIASFWSLCLREHANIILAAWHVRKQLEQSAGHAPYALVSQQTREAQADGSEQQGVNSCAIHGIAPGRLLPGNLLVHQGRISAVIDFGCLGVGDPACDLIVAWALLSEETRSKPEIRQASEKAPPPDPAPAEFGLLPGSADQYTITSGQFKGQRGFFTRDPSGAVFRVDLADRLFSRVPTTAA
jgi:hypothetical protein